MRSALAKHDIVQLKVPTVSGVRGLARVSQDFRGGPDDSVFVETEEGPAELCRFQVAKVQGDPAYRLMRKRLPYGLWTCADGREVLFNRDYKAIWQRQNGPAEPNEPNEWVRYVRQGYFFNDGTAPWLADNAYWRHLRPKRRDRIERLERILADFKAGKPIAHEVDKHRETYWQK